MKLPYQPQFGSNLLRPIRLEGPVFARKRETKGGKFFLVFSRGSSFHISRIEIVVVIWNEQWRHAWKCSRASCARSLIYWSDSERNKNLSIANIRDGLFMDVDLNANESKAECESAKLYHELILLCRSICKWYRTIKFKSTLSPH